MALFQTETYFALKAAGAPEAEAREAAEAAADIDIRHTVMAERLHGLDSKLNWIGATTSIPFWVLQPECCGVSRKTWLVGKERLTEGQFLVGGTPIPPAKHIPVFRVFLRLVQRLFTVTLSPSEVYCL